MASELQRAEAALEDAIQEKRDATVRAGFVERLREGWQRVHENNHLADLFTEEYGRIR